MTQDDIIEMAIKAELNLYVHDLTEKQYIQVIETFAKLVAAKHDPKIAIADAYRAGVDSGIAAEREACAKLAEEYGTWGGSNFKEWFDKLATEIRSKK
jgi:hypothetical protein